MESYNFIGLPVLAEKNSTTNFKKSYTHTGILFLWEFCQTLHKIIATLSTYPK